MTLWSETRGEAACPLTLPNVERGRIRLIVQAITASGRKQAGMEGPTDEGARLDSSEFPFPAGKSAEVNTPTACIPARPRRSRLLRLQTRRVWRSVENSMDAVVYRAQDLFSELLERTREKTQATAPAPDADAPRPSADDWAAWADKHLPAEDAEIFQRPAAS
jgi:hypothetical protein